MAQARKPKSKGATRRSKHCFLDKQTSVDVSEWKAKLSTLSAQVDALESFKLKRNETTGKLEVVGDPKLATLQVDLSSDKKEKREPSSPPSQPSDILFLTLEEHSKTEER